MANLGEQLWKHPNEGKTAAIRLITLKYTTRCEGKVKCPQRGTVGLECRDASGHPIWRKDFCDSHARPLIARSAAACRRSIVSRPYTRLRGPPSSRANNLTWE
jgi:hypothetical protein